MDAAVVDDVFVPVPVVAVVSSSPHAETRATTETHTKPKNPNTFIVSLSAAA
jgi:hypothetical protein